jgi:peptidoglycan/xylan/chitin deacetylase (PgdA/CDA1 family)
MRPRRRAIWRAAAFAILLFGAAAAVHGISNARCFALSGQSICRVDTQHKLIALTFDDGPTEQGVEHALSELGGRGAKATFFLIGREVDQRPHLVRRISEAGHEIANHSRSHRMLIGHEAAFYDQELRAAHASLVRAGALPPTLFRPPYGKKLWGLPAAVERQGYRMIMVDVEEPRTTDPRAYAKTIVDEARPGSILLMHLMYRSNETARQALPFVIEGLKERGFRLVTVSELLASGQPVGR